MHNRYILLTAAKNEEGYIGEAIESVLTQTVRPIAWFIMDDGSTDKTAEVVAGFATRHPFIKLHSAGERQGRNFGSQYKAITAAYNMATELSFEFLGVHDADIAPECADYYESILAKFQENPYLGIAGGYVHERYNGKWTCRKGNALDSVAGGIQMFRRSCFEEIGGYTPLHLGGSDWLAQINSAMAGWQILACQDLPVRHYRPTSTANGRLRGLFQLGLLDASFGSHPMFEMFKCARRLTLAPVLISATCRLAGYWYWKFSGRKPILPPETVAFLRRDQMGKVESYLKAMWSRAPMSKHLRPKSHGPVQL